MTANGQGVGGPRRSRRRVCIVTPSYVSSTPRVVREADALSAAGYDVRVVFTQGQLENVRAFDDALLKAKSWTHSVFKWSNQRTEERWAYFRTGLRHRLLQRAPSPIRARPGLVERAESRVYPELAALAGEEPADLFIGHYPAGLAAAASAAERYGARLGYDVEDLYADTFPPGPEWAAARERILDIERRYVPACVQVTAVSGPVSVAFADRYGVAEPVVVHNCHAWADRDAIDGLTLDRTSTALSLFWFSQTVGLDRGLQDAIRAAGRLSAPLQIHVRGELSADVREALERTAVESGVLASLTFHAPCPPTALLSRAAEHDVGLALEPGLWLNHRLTVSNKLFLYLTAGLAVAATDLPGQRGIVEQSPGAAVLYSPGDVDGLAGHLQYWCANPGSLRSAKAAALEAARTRWNAERESVRLVAAVDRVFLPTGHLSQASGH